jgi:quinol monooxygenase YgiN
MLVVRVLVQVKPEQRAEFIRISTPLIQQTNDEPGCLFYSCYNDLADPNKFLFYEEYENEAAIDFHNQTEHRQNWWEAVQTTLAVKMEAKILANSQETIVIIEE